MYFFPLKDKKVLNNKKALEVNVMFISEAEENQERSSVFAVFKKVNDFLSTLEIFYKVEQSVVPYISLFCSLF